MRNRWLVAAALSAGVLVRVDAGWAQRNMQGRYALQARAGLGIPLNEFRDATQPDFEAGGKFQYCLRNQFALLLSWVHYPDLDFRERLGEGSFRLSPITAESNLYLRGTGRVRPYVTGGVGYYRLTRDARNSTPRTEHQLGSNVGFGAEWFLGLRGAIVADVRYHIPGRNAQVLTIGAGLNIYMSQ